MVGLQPGPGPELDATSPVASGGHLPGRRLLFLLPFAPRLDATHGGGRVSAQLIAALSERHRVAMLYMRAPDEPGPDERLSNCCELVEEVERAGCGDSFVQRSRRTVRLLASLIRLKPLWVTDCSSRECFSRIRQLVPDWKPDIVHVEYHVMGQYLSALRDCPAPCVLTEHEPGVRSAPYIKQTHSRVVRPIHWLDRAAWKRFERDIIRRVQVVVTFTRSDQSILERLAPEASVVRIPFGTVIPEAPLDPRGGVPPSLLFTGSFIHPPNMSAATRLIQGIFPRVQASYPKLKLFIVGSSPPELVRRMGNPNIVVTGLVEDVHPYLDAATVVVAPLHSGGGMRVKVLEALAAGKAVVASRLAVEGLDVTDGEQVVLAESDQEFAEQILRLLGDVELRKSLATRAREWAVANLGWDKSIAAYEELYRKLLSGAAI